MEPRKDSSSLRQHKFIPSMTEKITKLALASRLMVLFLQLLSNSLLPDHKPDVFRAPTASYAHAADSFVHGGSPLNPPRDDAYNTIMNNSTGATKSFLDKTVDFCLGGLRHWDGEYFLHIAEYTYSYENTLAFYPLYPMVVRIMAQWLHVISQTVGLTVSLRSWTLLVAVALNIYCFCKAATCMYELTQRIFGDLNKSWNAALLFCFNPASIFFSAVYSEALFCLVSLQLMLECVMGLKAPRIATTLALSVVSRSNGLVNAGFPVYFHLRKMILRPAQSVSLLPKMLFPLVSALIPLTLFYFYAFRQFCQPEHAVSHAPEVMAYARERNYILAGHRQPHNSPWCDWPFPYPYSYIQSHYWNVGFLRYYELKQLPNFLIAFPILTFILYHCWQYFRHIFRTLLLKYPYRQLLEEYKSFPFVVHSLVLALFCIFFVHIQISTRLLCSATPCLYWFAADHMPKTFDLIKLRSKAGFIVTWFGSYFVLGTVLFSNNMPWT